MKPLYLSKTVWGAILAVVSYVANRMMTTPPQTTQEWVTLIFEAVGALLAAIGLRDAIRKEGTA